MAKQTITKEGWKSINDELDYLIKVERPRIVQAIAVAREQGDLSENAEYSAAKEQQGIIEDRIAKLQHLLDNSEILVDSDVANDKISIGCKVKVFDVDMNEEIVYSLVNTAEADLDKGKISIRSKLGEAMLGKRVGATFTIHAPSGNYEYKVLEITK